MGYLVCEKCGGYYELQEGESPEDFTKCECGGKLKYVKELDQLNPKSDELKKMSKCSFCGTENLEDDQFCGNCGRPLHSMGKSEMSSKVKSKLTDKISRYRTKRNYALFTIGILGIVIIIFSTFWLPGMVFANHYEDDYVSFDYPYNANVTEGDNHDYILNAIASGDESYFTDSMNYIEGTYFKTLVVVSEGLSYGAPSPAPLPIDSARGGYIIYIDIHPNTVNETVPVNKTINQTDGLNDDGSVNFSPVNVTDFASENVNKLQQMLNENNESGKLKSTTKDDLTYYDLGSETSVNNLQNITNYTTIIAKKDVPYFFVISLEIYEPEGSKNDASGLGAYEKLLSTFKIGKDK